MRLRPAAGVDSDTGFRWCIWHKSPVSKEVDVLVAIAFVFCVEAALRLANTHAARDDALATGDATTSTRAIDTGVSGCTHFSQVCLIEPIHLQPLNTLTHTHNHTPAHQKQKARDAAEAPCLLRTLCFWRGAFSATCGGAAAFSGGLLRLRSNYVDTGRVPAADALPL